MSTNVQTYQRDDRQENVLEAVPLLAHKDEKAPSVFTPENLLREARRQKGLAQGHVPHVCLLDPDGDLVEHLRRTGRTQRHPTWACYHTDLDTFVHEGVEYGIVGRAVGASFAVLVAEELFASGCDLLVSMTSAGQITSLGQPPYVVLIEKALRDEGTSYHYQPPSRYSTLSPSLKKVISAEWDDTHVPLYVGASWTTDAPFRETEKAIAAYRDEGILTVEMEAAALYALAAHKKKDIICFAHVTNQMAQTEGEFEKGEDAGSITTLHVIHQAVQRWTLWRG
jgi:uridine phosphorylase